MNKNELVKRSLRSINIVPVVALHSVEDALMLGETLSSAGLNCIEVTFRTEQAAQCIEAIKSEYPDMLVAAGTVLNIEQAVTAIASDCDFIVSPAINPSVVEFCQKKNMAIVPGVCNPQQIEQGIALGLDLLKFFPAEVYGGIALLKAVAPIYPVTFMPTGGINTDNWKDYIDLPNVLCCGGSWIANDERVKDRDWNLIRESAAATVSSKKPLISE